MRPRNLASAGSNTHAIISEGRREYNTYAAYVGPFNRVKSWTRNWSQQYNVVRQGAAHKELERQARRTLRVISGVGKSRTLIRPEGSWKLPESV